MVHSIYETVFCLFTPVLMDACFFQPGGAVNTAAMNTSIEVSPSVPVLILWGTYLGVEMLDHTVVLQLTF